MKSSKKMREFLYFTQLPIGKFNIKWLSLLTILAVFGCSGTVQRNTLQQASFPSLISSLNGMENLSFCGEDVPVEIQEVRERLEKQILLTLWNRSQVVLWFKRSSRYFGHIEKLLEENGMPFDLKYLAVAESDLRPHAVSNKRAVGFWQFMASTGRKYGLVINEHIDERRNFFTSTQAAIRYLDTLHRLMGSWTLALAAYNMGEEGLTAKILEQGSKDYYRLYLPLETQQFIFRVLAIKLIFSNPEKYGFSLSDEDYYPPLIFDTINLDCLQKIPLRLVAQAANTDFKVIKDLNPEIRGYHLNAGGYLIRVPKGAAEGFHARFKRLSDRLESITYVVEEGDNLSLIAQRFDVPLSALVTWNRLDAKCPIQPGDKLFVFPNGLTFDENETQMEDSMSNGKASCLEQGSKGNDSRIELPGKDDSGIVPPDC
jgi:hypothetical protein